MKILCLSDLHGYLPDNLPKHDLLLLAGDIEPNFERNVEKDAILQKEWVFGPFKEWCNNLNNTLGVVGIAGNHTRWGEKTCVSLQFKKAVIYGYTHSHPFQGVQFGFCPYSLQVGNWSFGKNEAGLKEELDKLGKVDILITHGPPKHILDGQNWGSYALLHYIEEYKPKFVICGHIHESYGIATYDQTTIINCCYLNAQYKPSNPAIMLEANMNIELAPNHKIIHV